MIIIVVSVVTITYPHPAEAGILSAILRLFTGPFTHEPIEASAVSGMISLLEDPRTPPESDEPGGGAGSVREDFPLIITPDSALVAPRNPLGLLDSEESHDSIATYIVQSGDSPTGIAKRFGVSVNTILWANNIRNPNLIKAGDQLVILPVSGIHYEVQSGDTIESIARRFRPRDDTTDLGSVISDILNFNGLGINEPLAVGMMLIIPDGEIVTPVSIPSPRSRPGSSSRPYSSSGRLAELPASQTIGYFVRPINGGRRSRGVHGYNGIDLANFCGLPVIASAEGKVILARSTGWNGGYGQYIVISHPNGTQTLYAHLDAIHVSVGQEVPQGFTIGDIGSTGNSTGCHVHFEIRGAKNPF